MLATVFVGFMRMEVGATWRKDMGDVLDTKPKYAPVATTRATATATWLILEGASWLTMYEDSQGIMYNNHWSREKKCSDAIFGPL